MFQLSITSTWKYPFNTSFRCSRQQKNNLEYSYYAMADNQVETEVKENPSIEKPETLVTEGSKVAVSEVTEQLASSVDPGLEHPQRKIVIAVEESDESQYALHWALDNIVRKSDKLHILHAQPPLKLYGGPLGPAHYMASAPVYVPTDYFESMKKHSEQKSKNILKAAKEVAKGKGFHAEGDVIEGEPREAICSALDQLKADLLVMGSHGFGAIKRAFLGSVSDYCVHHAPCPVTIVRKPIRK